LNGNQLDVIDESNDLVWKCCRRRPSSEGPCWFL